MLSALFVSIFVFVVDGLKEDVGLCDGTAVGFSVGLILGGDEDDALKNGDCDDQPKHVKLLRSQYDSAGQSMSDPHWTHLPVSVLQRGLSFGQ